MSRKRRTKPAEAWKSQSKVSRHTCVSSSSSRSRSPARNCRRSTMRASGASERAAIRSAYTQSGTRHQRGGIAHPWNVGKEHEEYEEHEEHDRLGWESADFRTPGYSSST